MATYSMAFATLKDAQPWLESLTRIEGCTVRVTREPARMSWGRKVPPQWVVKFTHQHLKGRVYLHPEGLQLSSDRLTTQYTLSGSCQVPVWECVLRFDGSVRDCTKNHEWAA